MYKHLFSSQDSNLFQDRILSIVALTVLERFVRPRLASNLQRPTFATRKAKTEGASHCAQLQNSNDGQCEPGISLPAQGYFRTFS